MSLFAIVALSAIFLSLAYGTYGTILSRLLRLDPKAKTPAVRMRDDVDYMPIETKFLLSQHFSAIAAAGPIVGPILAGVMFGWLPALLWILLGSVFIGGVHDMTALVASIRHNARSIAEVVRDHMNRRAYLLFLAFVWLSLVYIIVAFTDITASSFLGSVELENGQMVSGGGIATSSLLYLALPVIMGCALRYTKMSVNLATVIFLPLVALAIWIGQYLPFDIGGLFGLSPANSQRTWNVALLIYCFVASVVPLWLLLQPRGHLGGYFLLFALAGGMLGVIFGNNPIQYPSFTNWVTPKSEPLFPMLFIVIACGACSGFHAIIASGTTSKQLRTEPDAKVVGYGTMLLEAMVAVVSLCCVMMLPPNSPLLTGPKGPQPNFLYAQGIGDFLSVVGIPATFGVAFGLMAFTTFVYDTLDVCTRLGRYILQELTGWQGSLGRSFATALTAGAPLGFLMWQPTDASGKVVPVWRVFWELFGASNQLLAALTLMGVTVWLWRTYQARWVPILIGAPMAWMYAMSMWALARIAIVNVTTKGWFGGPVPWVASLLVLLGALMLVEALRVVAGGMPPSSRDPAEVGAPAPA